MNCIWYHMIYKKHKNDIKKGGGRMSPIINNQLLN